MCYQGTYLYLIFNFFYIITYFTYNIVFLKIDLNFKNYPVCIYNSLQTLYFFNNKYLLIISGSNKWLHLLYDISKVDPVFCPNQCGRCYRGDQRRGHLKRHLDTECGVPKRFQCTICFKRFSQKWSLKKHILLVHKIIN